MTVKPFFILLVYQLWIKTEKKIGPYEMIKKIKKSGAGSYNSVYSKNELVEYVWNDFLYLLHMGIIFYDKNWDGFYLVTLIIVLKYPNKKLWSFLIDHVNHR